MIVNAESQAGSSEKSIDVLEDRASRITRNVLRAKNLRITKSVIQVLRILDRRRVIGYAPNSRRKCERVSPRFRFGSS